MDSNNRTKASNSRMINIFRKMLSEKWHAMIGPDRKDGGGGDRRRRFSGEERTGEESRMGDEEKEFDSSCIPSAYPLNDRSIIDHYYRMTGPYCRGISASTPPPISFSALYRGPFRRLPAPHPAWGTACGGHRSLVLLEHPPRVSRIPA